MGGPANTQFRDIIQEGGHHWDKIEESGEIWTQARSRRLVVAQAAVSAQRRQYLSTRPTTEMGVKLPIQAYPQLQIYWQLGWNGAAVAVGGQTFYVR